MSTAGAAREGKNMLRKWLTAAANAMKKVIGRTDAGSGEGNSPDCAQDAAVMHDDAGTTAAGRGRMAMHGKKPDTAMRSHPEQTAVCSGPGTISRTRLAYGRMTYTDAGRAGRRRRRDTQHARRSARGWPLCRQMEEAT